jgi:hypothetical protein
MILIILLIISVIKAINAQDVLIWTVSVAYGGNFEPTYQNGTSSFCYNTPDFNNSKPPLCDIISMQVLISRSNKDMRDLYESNKLVFLYNGGYTPISGDGTFGPNGFFAGGACTPFHISNGIESTWSGSYDNGTFSDANCLNWSSNSSLDSGQSGNTCNINQGYSITCDGANSVVCSCLGYYSTSSPTNSPTVWPYLPVIVQPITNYTNSPRLACPTPCPVTVSFNDPEYTPSIDMVNTSYINYVNATVTYPDYTFPLIYNVLTLFDDVICLPPVNPAWGILYTNLTGLPCSGISFSNTVYTVLDKIYNVSIIENIQVMFLGSFTYIPQLQEISVTVPSGILGFGYMGFAFLPVLRKVNLVALSDINVVVLNCDSLPYFNFPLYNFQIESSYNGNLMGISVKNLNGITITDNAAFERLDVINRTSIQPGTYTINTRSERFGNSRPNCVGALNETYFIDECLPVNDAPGRNETECPQPIAHKCLTNLYYNESCWLSEWIVPVFNLTTNIKDCSFDSNHWFNVTTLYVLNTGIIIPARVRANNTIYINSVSPSKNPSRNPTRPTNSPSLNPSLNPTQPTNLPSKNPTLNPTQPTNSPSNNPTLNPTQPTNSPTNNPTLNPTTTSPSISPTNPSKMPTNVSIYIYIRHTQVKTNKTN